MPFNLMQRRSKKSLPKIKAPIRKARLTYDDEIMIDRKSPTPFKKISINLDGTVSTLIKDGYWCVENGKSKTESRQFLHQTQMNEKLTKERQTLKRRNDILMDLAKIKTEEIDNMEKELRRLRHIVKKCAPKGCIKQVEKNK